MAASSGSRSRWGEAFRLRIRAGIPGAPCFQRGAGLGPASALVHKRLYHRVFRSHGEAGGFTPQVFMVPSPPQQAPISENVT